MRKALQGRRPRGVARGDVETIPAPIGGWNARDALTAMKATDARTLENWLVDAGKIRVRPGYVNWATGIGARVDTLMEWAPDSGLPKLFAAAPTAIYDVTGSGAVGAPSMSSLTNGRWQHVNFATPGGNFLGCVNGADGFRTFNGTTWATQAITGSAGGYTLDPTDLIHVCAHMNRLWFVENGTRRVWFLGIQAIAGAASLLDLSSICPKGGEILAMDTWTRDGGYGTDDFAVFVTSEGEVLLFAGVNPAASTSWALSGRYTIPRPIGRRCTFRLGAELLIQTVQGLLPLSRIMGLSVASAKNQAVNDKIAGAFSVAAKAVAGSFGWQVFEYTGANLLLVNVPVREGAEQHQYVFGTSTGAWSKFTGLNGGCWASLGGAPFFGGNDGVVRRFDAGSSDGGSAILATYEHAFVNLKTPAEKIFSLARPSLVAPSGYVPAVHIRTDYDRSPIDFRTIATPSQGAVWDEAVWDEAQWASGAVATEDWQTIEGAGRTVSVGFRVATTGELELNGTQIMFEKGGIL